METTEGNVLIFGNKKRLHKKIENRVEAFEIRRGRWPFSLYKFTSLHIQTSTLHITCCYYWFYGFRDFLKWECNRIFRRGFRFNLVLNP